MSSLIVILVTITHSLVLYKLLYKTNVKNPYVIYLYAIFVACLIFMTYSTRLPSWVDVFAAPVIYIGFILNAKVKNSLLILLIIYWAYPTIMRV